MEQKSKKLKDDIPQDEKLKNSTTPYWNLSYKEQVWSKINSITLKEKFRFLSYVIDMLTEYNSIFFLKKFFDMEKFYKKNNKIESIFLYKYWFS